ncbi:thiol reductant ABC exporter subunit CydC [Solicola gregarius]|uniref:Thiol reductant ABC exporter subunit CydC n=1 Tax=Solicola gregarius TaxID=2908642 RepID=A0AA46TFG1_9ACTN|nr:thiol reductant ABC exporter subunit CydC [Solicola gregarius]UYM04372.1 thiol reductant ABC exporter subunit CydC [Solicola gregarius]
MNRQLTVGAVLGVLSTWSMIGLLLTSGWLLSRAAEQPPVLYLMVAIVAVRAFGIARGGLRYAERLLTHDGVLRTLTRIRADVYEQIERRAPAGLGDRRRGDLVSRVVGDVDALQDSILRVRLPWLVTATAAAGTTVLVGIVLPTAGLALAVAVTIVVVGVPALVRAAGERVQSQVAPLRGDLAAAAAEAVHAAPDLVAYDATSLVRERIGEIDARLRRAERRTAWLEGLGSALVFAALGIAVAAMLWLGIPAVADGSLTPVLLAVVALAPVALLDPLDAIPAMSHTRARVAGARNRLDQLGRAPVPVADPPQGSGSPDGYGIEVHGLSAAWPGGPEVLHAVSLTLPEGAVATVTGPSGCGKSTLAAVLLKFLTPTAGQVTLGGIDLASLTGDEVRGVVGMLGQDEHVFDTSIRENLRIARPDASEAALWEALDRAGLGHFVRGLPAQLDTAVGENGARLSGGERQRLGLARLLLGDHRVLILDEPTEQLDEEAGDALLADLLALAPERSILLITHRPLGSAVPRAARSVRIGEASAEKSATEHVPAR